MIESSAEIIILPPTSHTPHREGTPPNQCSHPKKYKRREQIMMGDINDKHLKMYFDYNAPSIQYQQNTGKRRRRSQRLQDKAAAKSKSRK